LLAGLSSQYFSHFLIISHASGRVTVTGRVVDMTPNVTGQIVAIPVKPNVPVKANDGLFQIDQAPFQYKLNLPNG
jgi:multidrug resistance efflux pump